LDAEQTARLGLAIKGDDKARFLYVMFRTRVGERDWPGALVIANEALDKFPKSNAGYLLKGEYFGGIGDFEKSATFLERSREIVSNSEVNNHLVIAYYNTNRYKDAVSAFEQSARIDDTSMFDINTVLAAAAAYYEIGNRRASLELLEKHAGVVPESRHDPLFIKMHNILMNGKEK
jgi:tetratricopeptide (TPR) repeat protein